MQQSFCRLDQVLITFGYLTMKYHDEKMKQDVIGHQAILASIETRWAKSDQEVFIAAVLVNPFYRMSAFRPLQCFNKAEIRLLFTRLFQRFYSREPSHAFIADTYDFLDGKGMFRTILSEIEFEIASALNKVSQYLLHFYGHGHLISALRRHRRNSQIHLICSRNSFLQVVLRTPLPLSFLPVVFFPLPQILHHVNGSSVFSAPFSPKLVTGQETLSLPSLQKSKCISGTNTLQRGQNLG